MQPGCYNYFYYIFTSYITNYLNYTEVRLEWFNQVTWRVNHGKYFFYHGATGSLKMYVIFQ